MKTVEELVEFASKVDGQGTEDHQNCTYTRAELTALAKTLVKLPPMARVVEIGVYCGRSASLYLQLQNDLELDVHLIDNWSWAQSLAAHSFVDLVLKDFNEVPFHLHKMLSSRLGEGTAYFPIDFLHIDGWHDFDGINPDCKLWLRHVVAGGYVAFHDSDCAPVAECISKYVLADDRWSKVEAEFRTTVFQRKANGWIGVEKPCLP